MAVIDKTATRAAPAVPIAPTAYRDFRRSDLLTALFYVYQKDPKTLAPGRLTVRVRDIKDVAAIDETQTIEIDRFTNTGPPAAAEVRYRVPLGDVLVAEVDRYDGALEGLWTVEVELPSEEAAAAFTPPPWFGEELTGVPGWSNADLALGGRPSS